MKWLHPYLRMWYVVYYVCMYVVCMYVYVYMYVCMYVCEGRDEAIASGGVILETKKQPETVLHKYFYFHPENVCSRCHGFIPTP